MFYHYNALQIGLVLLAFGLGMLPLIIFSIIKVKQSVGCMGGSLLGGRWSDKVLRRLRAQNGGQGHPEVFTYVVCGETAI